jgi:hypothetical protein
MTKYKMGQTFDIDLACEYGLDIAIFIDASYRLMGQYPEEFKRFEEIVFMFPYWDLEKIQNLLDKMVELNFIEKMTLSNRLNTLMYRLNLEKWT